MKIGVCVDPAIALSWPSFPGDFIEANVQKLLVPESDEDVYQQSLTVMAPLRGRISAANCFLPGDLKVVGPHVDHERLVRYADTAFRRGSELGIKTIVFGSGGARQIPDGWSHADAFLQFIEALEICAPLAAKHGVTLVVEPLNRGECNLVNTVIEGAVAVAQVDHPNIRLLVDIFHMLRNEESPEDIVKVGPWIAHAHIAEKADRTAPGVRGDDFSAFFRALEKAGYKGDMSIECALGQDPYGEIKTAVQRLRA